MGKTYAVGIVGESFYQKAVRKVRAGDRVKLVHTPDNEHDSDAVAVYCHGKQIGHLERGSRTREAFLDGELQGGVTVSHTAGGAGDDVGVWLAVRFKGSTRNQSENASNRAAAALNRFFKEALYALLKIIAGLVVLVMVLTWWPA